MDTMDFVKRAWATLDLSSPFKPTLSLEELDKRIADLRAVEQWLALNQGMLRNTIQGLEIQRGTLATVQSLTDSFGRMTWPPGEDAAEALARFAAASLQPPHARTPGTPPIEAASAAPAQPASDAGADRFASAGAERTRETGETKGSKGNEGSDAAGPPGAGAAPSLPAWGGSIDPLAWWKALQDNFEQIARMAVATPDADTRQTGAEATAKQRSATAKPSSKARPPRGTGTKPAPRARGRQAARGGPDAAGASARAKSREEQ